MYNCLGNSIATYGNGKGLFEQPFMEMERDCLSNRLWKRKGAVWATAYGNGRGLFGQPLYPT